MTQLRKAPKIGSDEHLVVLTDQQLRLSEFGFSKAELDYITNAVKKEERKLVVLNQLRRIVFVQIKENKDNPNKRLETIRKAAAALVLPFNEHKITAVTVADLSGRNDDLVAFTEGLVLGNYQFLKYKKPTTKETNTLQTVSLHGKGLREDDVRRLDIIVSAVGIARDLVNEPVNNLSAVQLAEAFRGLGKDAGFHVEVFNKSKIESLKMGGLLAVNKGSTLPPTFTIMEYKPARARNKKPIVLVGKGVVYDTGGYNIKTGAGMETMKCDMGGAATVGATIWAAAKAKLPVHLIGLVPATDNRIDGDAYVAGDVLTMYNGMTVEVLNTDAEGRLILADALSYGEQYKPELVMEFSTLTGAALAAVGSFGLVCMGTADERVKTRLRKSGERVYERLAEFPFWEEYDELIKSDVAEIKNIGGPYAGAITAGRFLNFFVKSPFMHFDIAGPAFLPAKEGYRMKGGTGVGVRMLFDFFSNY